MDRAHARTLCQLHAQTRSAPPSVPEATRGLETTRAATGSRAALPASTRRSSAQRDSTSTSADARVIGPRDALTGDVSMHKTESRSGFLEIRSAETTSHVSVESGRLASAHSTSISTMTALMPDATTSPHRVVQITDVFLASPVEEFQTTRHADHTSPVRRYPPECTRLSSVLRDLCGMDNAEPPFPRVPIVETLDVLEGQRIQGIQCPDRATNSSHVSLVSTRRMPVLPTSICTRMETAILSDPQVAQITDAHFTLLGVGDDSQGTVRVKLVSFASTLETAWNTRSRPAKWLDSTWATVDAPILHRLAVQMFVAPPCLSLANAGMGTPLATHITDVIMEFTGH